MEGGLYAILDDSGVGYKVLKILKIDDYGFHIRIYNNLFRNIPKTLDPYTLSMGPSDIEEQDNIISHGHLPISKEHFYNWKMHFIMRTEISPDELVGYKIWLEHEGGYF